ncbi:hypothetical protein WA026_000861 [Henosepilachna vigintioctopunctata]|uniref:Uncharacterized protein n=1 Tax=Henosepilachna vigintioctopunctata TaxID=420089 RepID=A0AAW1V828_9CUCU
MEDPSQEDVSSIYDDLMGQGDLGLIIHNLQIRNKHLQQHVTSLEEDIQKLCDKITEMKQTQENLSRNISELYKTAKNEIDRKDRLIAELQSRLDDMIFKRNTAPSNFGFKRQREEVTHPGETYKRLRSDVKSEQNREQNKDNSVHQSELPKSSYHNNDKKSEVHEKKRSEVYDKKTTEMNQINSEYEVSKNYRNNDIRDNMKHQNFVRNDERKSDIRDHSRYGRDSKRSSNSRNYRRDNERSFRRYNDRDRRSSRDRDYKADRFDEHREAKNKNPRNERLNREHHRSDDREPIGSKREIKNEPRFSSVESTRSTPEFVVEAEDCLNVSREEGEIVENDSNIKPVPSDKIKYDSEINIHKESIVLCDNKINPPRDKIHKSKSIDKYNTVSEKKETGGKIIEKHNKGDKLDNKHQHFDENVINDMKDIVEEKRDNVQIMENVTSKECDVKIISSVDKDSWELKEESVEKEGVKTEKITIISQVVLNESKTENIESRVGTEVISKEVTKPETLNKIGCSTEHKIVKVDKPIRESGVPRNLTGELDINIGKSRLVRDNIKELYADKNERIRKKISKRI